MPTSAAADVVTDHLGAAVQVTHGDDDAEHRGHDAEARQGVARGADQRDGLGFFVVMRLQLRSNSSDSSSGEQPSTSCFRPSTRNVSAWCAMHHGGIVREQRARPRCAHVRLERQHAFAADQRQDLIEELQQLHVVALGRREP